MLQLLGQVQVTAQQFPQVRHEATRFGVIVKVVEALVEA
jgi:hypothetical protein